MTFDSNDHPRDDSSGRFVTAARCEPPAQVMQEAQAAARLYEVADQLAFTTQMTDEDKALARERALEVLGPLPDAEQRWDDIRHAAEQWVWFEDEDEGDQRAGEELTAEQTLDVDIEQFAGYSEADRADENGYLGYDFRAYADELADAWRLELDRRTKSAAAALAAHVRRT